jgi:membrane-bound serine protease (ClpP class)
MPSPSIELAALLLVAGLCLLFLELFVPSAGVLFALALVCIVLSVVAAFLSSLTAGLVFLAADVLLAIVLPGVGIRLWQKTPIGRRMFLEEPSRSGAESTAGQSGGESDDFAAPVSVGEEGRTITPLRPSGTADFQGRRVDAVSEGVMIERGKPVRVVKVEGRRIVVREVE